MKNLIKVVWISFGVFCVLWPLAVLVAYLWDKIFKTASLNLVAFELIGKLSQGYIVFGLVVILFIGIAILQVVILDVKEKNKK